MKIDIIGSYPPPYGGISIHIKRLSEHLREKGVACTVYDTSAAGLGGSPPEKGPDVIPITRPVTWAMKYFCTTDADIVHLDAADDWKLRLYAGLAIGWLRRKKLVITINGNDIAWPYAISCLKKPGAGFFGRLLAGLVILAHRRAAYVACTNEDIRKLMLSAGIRPGRCGTVSAFIPPVVRAEDARGLPPEVLSFLESHSPVISAGAFKINFYRGQDVYGLDMCVALCANLKQTYPRIGVIFCLPIIGDEDYFSRMNREIKEKNIGDNFMFITRPLNEVYTIWQQSDIFVRPTVTDGDAVSLREALYLKTPSVASDVVPRPEGTVLFQTGDIEDFTARVKMVWDNYSSYKAKSEAITVAGGLDEMFQVYGKLAGTGWTG